MHGFSFRVGCAQVIHRAAAPPRDQGLGMQPLIIRNPHRTDLKVLIKPGQISISVPPGDAVKIEIHNMPEGETIEIAPDPGPGLSLVIPTSQFTIKIGRAHV